MKLTAALTLLEDVAAMSNHPDADQAFDVVKARLAEAEDLAGLAEHIAGTPGAAPRARLG